MKDTIQNLSRRERQIMDVLIAKGDASAKEVMESIPNPPSYSAVRALIAKLVDKGHARYRQEGAKYVFSAAQDMKVVRSGALKRLVNTFFGGSAADAVTGLLDRHAQDLTDEELEILERRIAAARNRAGKSTE